ncbi:hypothetical protein QFC21_005855 [Naganishia friedmannii]|uniref:Uncharacterized protein n=1 Tax=Naganishia friedmannii TaxID=89922 RepID=A0ACC2V6J0_9TREE|nr:hypothetical protein QFC21_005855 [Naganishia friedmannii]
MALTVPESSASLNDSDRDIFWGVVADDRVLPEKQVDYLKVCLGVLSDKLSEGPSDSNEGPSCWVTRLSLHTNNGGGTYWDSDWKGSIVHHTPGENPVLISGAGTNVRSFQTRWSGEGAPETIADKEDRPVSHSDDPAKLCADATHVLAFQTIRMVDGAVLHGILTKAFDSKSIDKLDEWLARQFRGSPMLPPNFAQDVTQMFLLSKELWAKMEKEAEMNGDPECVTMAKLHQEALVGLLASPMLREKGIVTGPQRTQQAKRRRIRDPVLPVSQALQNFVRPLLGGRV